MLDRGGLIFGAMSGHSLECRVLRGMSTKATYAIGVGAVLEYD